MWQLLSDLRSYERTWLLRDVAAAVTVWAIVVPESVAYAGIAGVPPEVGLYVSVMGRHHGDNGLAQARRRL